MIGHWDEHYYQTVTAVPVVEFKLIHRKYIVVNLFVVPLLCHIHSQTILDYFYRFISYKKNNKKHINI